MSLVALKEIVYIYGKIFNGDGNFDGGETSTLVANNIDSISLNTAYLYELPESINSSIELGVLSALLWEEMYF